MKINNLCGFDSFCRANKKSAKRNRINSEYLFIRILYSEKLRIRGFVLSNSYPFYSTYEMLTDLNRGLP